MSDTTDVIEHHLIIEFVFRQRRSWGFPRTRYPVQGVPFKFGVRIENPTSRPFPGATISNFQGGSHTSSMGFLSHNVIAAPSLNPGDATILWIDSAETDLEGPIWLSCDVRAIEASHSVVTFQRERTSGNVSRFGDLNKWGDGGYIQRKMELLQAQTNVLLLILTALMFLDAVVGLKAMLQFVARGVGSLFSVLGAALMKLTG